ncbi:hypothetical protein SDC9_129670 [bioreactor metagenome]|uniref:Uncharacterized protein n=1 Tax=bioreactor metagenome TaxID=1076179 RepID=A0A645D0B0_9ZZZZ
MLNAPVLNFQHDFVLHVVFACGEAVGQLAADHAANDARFVHLAFRHIERFDYRAVADDGDAVGDIRDFVELVRNDNRRDSLFLELLEQVQQLH